MERVPATRTGENGPRRILIVEDEILIRKLIAEALRDSGYVVVEAGTADEAVAFIASQQRVDAVFTDVKLPGSMNGIQLAERIRKNHPQIKVLVTSGHVDHRVLKRVDKFLAKPYRLEELVRKIAQLFSDTSDRADE